MSAGGIWAVVLAAGLSQRMQQGGGIRRLKPLLPMPDGRLMLEWVTDTAVAADVAGVIVVTPDGEPGLQMTPAVADSAVVCVENSRFKEGQSTSVHVGIRALIARDAAAGVFLLADQPELTVAAVDAVVDQFRSGGAAVVQASYVDGPGHPVVFSAQLFNELLQVTGDEGGRSVVRAHIHDLVLATVDINAPVDIDTPEAYDALLARVSPSE